MNDESIHGESFKGRDNTYRLQLEYLQISRVFRPEFNFSQYIFDAMKVGDHLITTHQKRLCKASEGIRQACSDPKPQYTELALLSSRTLFYEGTQRTQNAEYEALCASACSCWRSHGPPSAVNRHLHALCIVTCYTDREWR